MNREQLLRALRKYARKRGLHFDVNTSRGSGSHYLVTLGDNWTTVQDKLDPHKVRTILKQLGVDPYSI